MSDNKNTKTDASVTQECLCLPRNSTEYNSYTL